MSATFEVTVETRMLGLLDGLKNVEKRKAYALAGAINTTAREIQAAERDKVKRTLTVRKTEFILRQAAIIKPRASASAKLFRAVISVGAKQRLLLRQFEQEHERVGQAALRRLGEKGVAVPVVGGARPSKRQIVPEDLWISRLKLKRPRATRAQKKRGVAMAARGLLRTYLVPQVGIFRRMSQGVKLLWAIVPSVSKAKRYEFLHTAQGIVRRRLLPNLQSEIAETLKYHLGR